MSTASNKVKLPQQSERLYITDGGLETYLMFQQGIELPNFAAFPLLESREGRNTLADYYRRYIGLAEKTGRGFIFESPTWRAHPVWGQEMGYDERALDALNREAIRFLSQLRAECGSQGEAHVISGCIGPRGDGYVADERMTVEEARDYHRAQVGSFTAAGADMTSALTMNYVEEAAGIVLAARDLGIAAVISFTTETDGHLPDGTTLQEAIETVDAVTDDGPAYYMLNCAHPDHFSGALESGSEWMQRVGGLRSNASRMSHAELDEAEELDAGDPVELGQMCAELQQAFPCIRVLGGCCGTDFRHVGHMCGAYS